MKLIVGIILIGVILLMSTGSCMGDDPTVGFEIEQCGKIIGEGEDVVINLPINISVTYKDWDANLDKNWKIGINKTGWLDPWDIILESGTDSSNSTWTITTNYTPTEIGNQYVAASCRQTGIHPGEFYYAYHVINIGIVPEPTTVALTMIGILAIIGFVWSRKKE